MFRKGMYKLISVIPLCVLFYFHGIPSALCQSNNIYIPDIPGYKTLKCDFHTHTVFSDGNVWPAIRIQEAFKEGLDVISITDHYEYLPHKNDVNIDFSRSYEIASPLAEQLNILLVPGGEITRNEPQGHHNAIFLTDIGAVSVPDSVESIRVAASQGAFIFWNHPGWKNPGKRAIWSAAQDTIFNNGLLNGIEVVNGHDYYPNAHAWCIEKGLTMMANSDIHGLVVEEYTNNIDGHRPMTLVFAKEKTIPSVKEALEKQRTAVYWKGNLAGDRIYLEPIFKKATEIVTPNVTVAGTGRAVVLVRNSCDIPFQLNLAEDYEPHEKGLKVPETVRIGAHQTAALGIQGVSQKQSGTRSLRLPYTVANLMVAPGRGMPVELPVTVTFVPGPAEVSTDK